MVLNAEATSHLEDLQRKSGVKDPIAQPLLESLLARRSALAPSTNIPSHVRTQIAKVLQEEHAARPPILRMNPLLNTRGKWCQPIGLTHVTDTSLDFDVHKDTPVEILHTVLLGAVKYYWRFTCKHLGKEDFKLFKVRFESLSVEGLDMGTSRIPEYVCRYPGSLIGTHFRFVVQLAPFALRGLIPPELFRVWLVLGRLTVLMWYKRIPDIDKYCVRHFCFNFLIGS